MSEKTIQVTELDVRRAQLIETLAKRLGKTPPPSVVRVARVKLPERRTSRTTNLSPSKAPHANPQSVSRTSKPGFGLGGGMS